MLWFLTLSFTDDMKDDEEYEHSPREFYHPDEDSMSIEASGITESYMEWKQIGMGEKHCLYFIVCGLLPS